jgi:uncharacterized protein (DUF58 family)
LSAAPHLPPAQPAHVRARAVAPLDLSLLASLPSLPLRSRYLVESYLTGLHRSPLKGTALEFAEYRNYQPGDDLRRLDWRLYGRSDRLHVKQFEEENQLRVCLVLDLSTSLRYRSQPQLLTKLDFARTLLGGLSLLARRQHDAVGLALVGDTPSPADGGLLDYLPPRSALAHHHALFSRLDQPPATRTAPLVDALHRLATLLPRGTLVVVASDFYTDLEPLRGALRLFRSQHLEFVGLHVLDPMEVDFNDDTAGLFTDLENGHVLPLSAPAARDGYLKRFQAHCHALTGLCREYDGELVLQRTDTDPLATLAAYVAHRAHLV